MHTSTRALACSIGGALISAGMAALTVPWLLPLGPPLGPRWQLGLFGGLALLMVPLWAWSRWVLRPLRRPPESPERRRAAHDYPYRLARVCFLGALGAGVASGLWLHIAWRLAAPESLAAGVLTYLLLLLPVLGLYLLTRRLLRGDAAGPPGAGPVGGIRQSLGLRISFALQLPVVISAAGIVLLEHRDEVAYTQALHQLRQVEYATVSAQVLATVDDPAARQWVAAAARPPRALGLLPGDRVQRPLWRRLHPLLLVALVLALTWLLGRWLALEVTTELGAVAAALRRLRSDSVPLFERDRSRAGRLAEARVGLATADLPPPPRSDLPAADEGWRPPRGVATRETARLVAAFAETLRAFAGRRQRMQVAALKRRAAEQSKARFLAHMSHELKSPLKSILGFTEVLLAELDGPLDDEQRERLWIVWRSGDSLFRFIAALLDLAPVEASDVDTRSHNPLPLAQVTPSALALAIEAQWRPDPLEAVGVQIVNAVADDELTVHIDLLRTARAIVLAAGILLDRLDRGRVEICLREGRSEAPGAAAVPGLVVAVSVRGSDLPPGEREILLAQVRSVERAESGGDEPDRSSAGAAGLVLVGRVARVQGGLLSVRVKDGCPRFEIWLPCRPRIHWAQGQRPVRVIG